MSHKGIKTYISPRERELSTEEHHIREVAYALKKPEKWAVIEAAEIMAPHITRASVLVPIPDSRGSTKANRVLAEEIASRSGATILDALSRKSEVPSSHLRRKKGLPGLSPDEHGMSGQIPEHIQKKNIVFIDNVITTGSTFDSAKRQLGGGRGLAYAKSKEVLRTSSKVMATKVARRFNTLFPTIKIETR